MKIAKYALAAAAGLLWMALPGALRADTIITSGGNVIEIEGITVAGVTYDVTWGPTADLTFATDPTDAATMTSDIAGDLNAYEAPGVGISDSFIVLGAYGVSSTYAAYALGAPLGGSCIPIAGPPAAGEWGTTVCDTGDFAMGVTDTPYLYAWDEFTVEAAVPESSSLLLLAAGLLGLLGISLRRQRLT